MFLVKWCIIAMLSYSLWSCGTKKEQTLDDSLESQTLENSPEVRVKEGEVVENIAATPWMVSIFTKQDGSPFLGHKCSGSIIGNKWIITACHCVHNDSNRLYLPSELSILYNTHRLDDETGLIIDVVEIIPFIKNKYAHTDCADHDIAILKLSSDINFTNTKSRIINLPVKDAWPEKLQLAGWGYTEKESQVQRELRMFNYNNSENRHCCLNTPDNIAHLCYPNNNKGTGNYDSGSGLVSNNESKIELLAIASGTKKCYANGCSNGYKCDFYVDINFYKSWILENID